VLTGPGASLPPQLVVPRRVEPAELPRLRPLILAVVALAAAPAAALAQATPPTGPVQQPSGTPAPTKPAPGYPAETPRPGALYRTGPTDRYLLGGTWLFRFDAKDEGVRQHWQRNASTAGWSRVTVPNAWNATDSSPQSFAGGVGFYRKDFKLPSSSSRYAWIVRFESVNYRSEVWLNGKPLGTNRGAYLPFEMRLPAGLLKRNGTNRLVIRVDNRRRPTDFPPSNLNPKGQPTGGWWNYGGLLREVYLRRVDRIDFSTVQVQPVVPCAACAATVHFRITVRNYAPSSQRVHLTTTFGSRRINLGTAAVVQRNGERRADREGVVSGDPAGAQRRRGR